VDVDITPLLFALFCISAKAALQAKSNPIGSDQIKATRIKTCQIETHEIEWDFLLSIRVLPRVEVVMLCEQRGHPTSFDTPMSLATPHAQAEMGVYVLQLLGEFTRRIDTSPGTSWIEYIWRGWFLPCRRYMLHRHPRTVVILPRCLNLYVGCRC
jgi:hypothetical protein